MVDFNASQIHEYKNEITNLFEGVINQSEFSLGEICSDTFFELKKALKDKYRFKAYFLNEKLIGFSSSTLLNNGTLDANYGGFDYSLNKEKALYQRMLYDLIDLAIGQGMKRVHFGRTAEELKSTLGAKPTNMKLYVRHRNQLSNQILKPIISSISPSSFDLRNPLKADFTFS